MQGLLDADGVDAAALTVIDEAAAEMRGES
jgi:hypothetical protein